MVAPKPRIELPIPPKIATSETPREGTDATQGASDVRGPGTGSGGSGHRDRERLGGGGSGGGGGGGAVEAPRLITPVLTERNFPRQLLYARPAGAPIFMRLRIDAQGGVLESTSTGEPAMRPSTRRFAERCRPTSVSGRR